jgi:Transposase IS116/IS110/IS902 family
LAFTIAGEIGEIERFSSPEKLTGYTGLCPRVNQSGEKDRRGPLTKHGPTYLRWALLEATMHALRHPAYSERYQRTKRRLGKQRGAKVAQIDIARRLAHAIWHMLSPQGGGEVRCAGRIETTPERVELFALEPHIARVVVVSPSDTEIRQARAKTDRLDARTLAKLLASGELDAVWMPDRETWVMRRRLARPGASWSGRARGRRTRSTRC